MNGDTVNTQAGDSAAFQGTGSDAATGQMAADNEVLRALSAAMAALFGDAPDSWLLEAEDVVEHLQADGYAIVRADRLERLIAVAENVLTWNQRGYLSPEQLGLQSGDLDPVASGEGGE